MLADVLQSLADFRDLLACWIRVHPYEGAVHLRRGRYLRTLGPGLYWKIPFFDEAIETNTCVTTMRLPPQTLTTKDDVAVVVAVVVKYQINNDKLREFVSDVWDQRDVLGDVTMGAVRQAVVGMTFEELKTNPPEEQIIELVRKQCNKYGFKIEKVTFTDLGRVRSFRLMLPPTKDLDN